MVNRGGEGSYLAILGFGPLVFANVGVNLMAPTLRALLAGAAGHLGGDGAVSLAPTGSGSPAQAWTFEAIETVSERGVTNPF